MTPRRDLLAGVGLVALVLLAFGQTGGHGFIRLDDPEYVTAQPHVRSGLSLEGVAWAFRTFENANWHPLTWLSHMLDCQLFGLDPGLHHLSALALHAANAVLLFLALRRLTGSHGPSAFTAALFAVHPLHVESVAWIAERKDLLSAFFGLLGLCWYAPWAETRKRGHAVLVFLCLALSLMAKPMLVTFPFVLLLLDVWPLRRLEARTLPRLVLEKAPLFALAAASCAVTLLAQRAGGALHPLAALPLAPRLANAAVSAVWYVAKTVWPAGLGIFYPYPAHFSTALVAGAVVLLAAGSAVALHARRTRPYVFTGWFWFLGMLVPVIGIVQVGQQARADRYSYLPIVGLFVIAGWGGAELLRGRPMLARAAAGLILSALTAATMVQVSHWRDTTTLFRHTLAVTGPNALVHNNLGLELREQGSPEALTQFTDAVRADPRLPDAHANLGLALLDRGDVDPALVHLEEAVRLRPGSATLQFDLGVGLVRNGELEAAAARFAEALRLEPDHGPARNNLGLVLDRLGRRAEAEAQLREAVRLQPQLAEAENNLGLVLAHQGRVAEALPHFERALRLDPGYGAARRNLEAFREYLRAHP